MLNLKLVGRTRRNIPEQNGQTVELLRDCPLEKINIFIFSTLLLVIITGIFFTEQIVLGSFLLETIILGMTLGWIGLQRMNFKSTLSLKKPTLKEMGITLIAIITGIYVASFVDQLFRYYLQNLGTVPASDIPQPKNIKEFIFTLSAVAFLPALAEETLFRGFVLKSYQRYLPAGKAILMSSLMFGLAHLSISNFWGPFILGLLCGWLVCTFNSLFLAVIAHFLNNGLTILVLYLTPEWEPQTISIKELLFLLPSVVIAGLILLMIILRYQPIMNIEMLGEGKLSLVWKHWSTWLLFLVFGLFAVLELLMITGKI